MQTFEHMFVGGGYLIDFNRDVIKFLYGSLFISTQLLLLKKSYDKKTHFNLVINLSLTVFKKNYNTDNISLFYSTYRPNIYI